MQSLDLRQIRCPLALVLLKQQLLGLDNGTHLEVLFSNQVAIQDIRLYLDKKNYCYRCNQNTLLITLDNQ
ncbi:sulfurtransferase TusA family protein [uncultured Psychromonas sp.]|uniref:sulfurtransferase TusA family protein n=1 Tax=uncultured Psychromonas sp. TaxID=173974 RepID=UPI0026153807|nr:sulfurtransferase TusA family protein [uncultured Psychromonas sp.]